MYNKILVAIDLSDDSHKVITTAVRLAEDPDKLHLVHVVEPVAAAYSMDLYAVNINELHEEAIAFAAERLKAIAREEGLQEDQIHTLPGSPAAEIPNLAMEIEADAIVIGSHGHSGWKALIGSTAMKLLHHARCDVLTVHVCCD